jgi:tetratricopeptide (TPR) repeat protein
MSKKSAFSWVFLIGFLFVVRATAQENNRHFLNAIQLAEKGMYDLALLQMDSALMLDSGAAYLYINKSDLEFELKRYPDAVKTISIGIEVLPDSAILYDARGNLLDAFQFHDDALLDYTKAFELAKSNELKAHALSNSGGVRFKMRQFEAAYNDFIRALTLDSSNIDALNNLASVCDYVDRGDETIGYLEQILEIDSNYVPALVNLGFKYQSTGHHQQAIDYFNRAIAIDSTEALAFSNRSYSKLQLGDSIGAMSDINRSLSLFAVNAYAYKVRALIYISTGYTDLACDDLATAMKYGYRERFGDEVDELIEKHCKE